MIFNVSKQVNKQQLSFYFFSNILVVKEFQLIYQKSV